MIAHLENGTGYQLFCFLLSASVGLEFLDVFWILVALVDNPRYIGLGYPILLGDIGLQLILTYNLVCDFYFLL